MFKISVNSQFQTGNRLPQIIRTAPVSKSALSSDMTYKHCTEAQEVFLSHGLSQKYNLATLFLMTLVVERSFSFF
jgi:hypothetical protein